jgi:hypothetical protein
MMIVSTGWDVQKQILDIFDRSHFYDSDYMHCPSTSTVYMQTLIREKIKIQIQKLKLKQN